MRQSTATWAIAVAVGIVLAALALFGFGRTLWWHDGHHVDHHGHTGQVNSEGQHHHGNAAQPDGGSTTKLSGQLIDGVRVIEVSARRFEFDPATIVVREGEKVRLKVISEDVTHGFGVASYHIDRKLEPGQTETIAFTADKPGRHHFHCTVYCGSGHGDMHGELIVQDSK